MNTITEISPEREERLRAEIADAFPALEPSPELRARVAAQVAEHLAQRPSAPRPTPPFCVWLRFGTVAAACVLFVLALAAWPRLVAARVLRRMESAVEKVRNFHGIYTEMTPDGQHPARKREIWYRDGSVRTEEADLGKPGAAPPRPISITLYENGRLWDYTPGNNEVRVRRQASYAHFITTGFTVAAMQKDFTRWGWRDRIQVLGDTTIHGRLARRVSIEREEPAGEVRTVLLVDPQTDLPFQMELWLKTREGIWVRRMSGEMRYDEPAADLARRFTPDFPTTAKQIDEDDVRRRLRERLAVGIAQKEAGDGRRIVIREICVNSAGDVFLLYTAGKRPGDAFHAGNRWAGRDWTVQLTDDRGNNYIPQNQSPLIQAAGAASSALLYNGERLEADAWTPRSHQGRLWQPRRFYLRFCVSPRNLHGGSGTERRADLTQSVLFTLWVDRAGSTLVPDFAPVIAPELDETRIAEAAANCRGELPPGVTPSPERIAVLSGNEDSIMSLAFSPNGQMIASGAWKSGIHIWDTESLRQIASWTGDTSAGLDANAIAFSPDSRYLAATAEVFSGRKQIRTDIQMRAVAAASKPLWTASLSEEKGDDSTGQLAFSPEGQSLQVLRYHIEARGAASVSGMAPVTAMSARLASWNAYTGATLGEGKHTETRPFFLGTPDAVNSALVTSTQQIDPTTHHIIRSIVEAWDGRTGALRRAYPAPDGLSLTRVVVSGDGQRIAAGGYEAPGGMGKGSIALLWDAHTGQLLQTVRGEGFADPIALSPHGSLLAMAMEKTVTVWDWRTGRKLTTLIGHGSVVRALAFSPDGSLLVTGDLSGKVMLWKVP